MPEQPILHDAVARMLGYFVYSHLPEHLQKVSYECCELAQKMAYSLPQGPELTVGLRKLLEAKDCFVRAALVVGEKSDA
jgi:hypothetical protein